MRKSIILITGRENGPSDEELKAGIKLLSGELKQTRKDLEYCADIAERSEQVHQNMTDLSRDNQAEAHERRTQYRDSRER